VDSCHHENIAVILDVVYNHFGPEGSYIAAFGPYFTDNYKTPWGSAINFDDEWSDGVRNYYLENALMWFRDFHIDGLRLDAVHAIKDFGAKHILGEIKENTDRLNSATGKTHFLLAESDLNDVRIINPPERGGYGIDLLMCDDFHHALHGLVTGEQHSYYSDFGKMSHLVKSFKDAFVFDGIFSSHRKKTFGNSTKGHPGSKFVVFSQNHDQIGNRMNGDRLSTLVDFETLKLLAAAIFFSPYVPFIFMGEEYGETNPFMYFTSHEGEKLIQYIRDGRKKEFEYLDAQGEVPDPQSLEAFNNSKLNWNNHSEEQIKLFEFYKELIRLRKAHPVLKNTDRIDLEADIIKETNALVLLRQYLQNLIICILNFEEKPVTLELQDSKKHLLVLLDSSQENHGIKQKIGNKLTVMPKSVLLVSDVKG
jgi:maltooligosyltrehalose trehalohydrolase